ncbi:MAG: hypothetical protein CMN32_03080 [Saprospirales bacterium]|nr:hypothetical protein [Saprospirales bacterium]
MIKNRLIKLLAALDRREMTRLNEFVHSPYFNKHKPTRRLCAYLSGLHPHFAEKKLKKELVFEQVFPEEEFDAQELALVSTYLTRLVMKFLQMEGAAESGLWEQKQHLLAKMRQHDVLGLYPLIYEQNKKDWTACQAGTNPRQHLRNCAELANELDKAAISFGKYDNSFLVGRQAVLDAAYITEKLHDACELLQRSKLMAAPPPDDPLLENLVFFLRQNPERYRNFPTVDIYLRVLLLLKSSDEKQYAPALKAAQEQQARLSFADQQIIYNYLQNFCIEQINKGNGSFLEELFRLYMVQLEERLFFEGGYLPQWHYKNIVTTGLRLGQTDWVRKFIEEYRQHLNPEVADNAYRYNLAAWYYHQGQPQEVMGLLFQVEYTDLRYNLDAKSLLLRTYYDLEEEEALLALTDAFRQYLKRNKKMSEFQKKGYYNLLKYTRRAFRLKINQGITRQDRWNRSLEKLIRDLAAADTVFNRSWLEGKVNELRGEG